MKQVDDSRSNSRLFEGLTRAGGRFFAVRRRLATGAAAALAVALAYVVVFGHNGLIMFKQKRDELRDQTIQEEYLRRENEQLKDHTDRLASDPNAIEHQAREELHYTRPGEVIYTLPAPIHPVKAADLK
jgi:cell division protein FtsB